MIIKEGLQLGLKTETIATLVDESIQKVEEIIQKVKMGGTIIIETIVNK